MRQQGASLSGRGPSAGGSARLGIKSRHEENTQWSQRREQAQEILQSVKFDIGIGIVIFLNAVSIGIEQALELGGHDLTALKVLESIFLTIYILELVLRIFAHGFKVFQDNWVRFDAIMVVSGIISTWIIEPAITSEELQGLGPVLILRMVRLLRLAKTGRLFERVEEFWRLTRSFLCSFPLMCYTFVILFIIMYIFAALGVELVTKNSLNQGPESDPEFQEVVRLYFDGLPLTMLTLVNFVCLDNMSDVWQPLISKDWRLSLYFITVVLVMGIIIMNIVTAVIIASTEEQNSQDRDSNKQEQDVKLHTVIKDLKKMFTRIDADMSGFLTRYEVLNISKDDYEFLSQALKVGTPVQVFNALDVEGTGKVTINDFFEALWDVSAKEKDLKLQRMEKQVEMMHWRVKETFDAQYLMSRAMDRLSDEIATLTTKVDSARSACDSPGGKSPPDTAANSKLADRLKARRPSVLAGTVFVGAPIQSVAEEEGEQLASKGGQTDGDKKATHRRSSAAQKMEMTWADTLSTRLQGILAESMQRSLEEVHAVAANVGNFSHRSSPEFSHQTSAKGERPPSPATSPTRYVSTGSRKNTARDAEKGCAKSSSPRVRRAPDAGSNQHQQGGASRQQRGAARGAPPAGEPPAATSSNNKSSQPPAAAEKAAGGSRKPPSAAGSSGSERAISSSGSSTRDDKVSLPTAGSSPSGRRGQMGERAAKRPTSGPGPVSELPPEAQGSAGFREQAPSRIVTM